MAAHVDMSLEDIIKSKKNSDRGRGQSRARRGRGPGGSFSGPRMIGPMRKGPLGVNARPSAYTIAKSFNRTRSFPWQHDLFEDSLRAAGISSIEVGTKIFVSNLDYRVTNDDIRGLFSEIGELKRYAIHYDKTGRPSGSAEVVYARRSDAFAVLKRYNNVPLDGKPMKIEVVGTNAEVPISARVNVTGVDGRRKRTVVMTPGSGRGGGSAPINRGSSQSHHGGMRNSGGMRSNGGMRSSGGMRNSGGIRNSGGMRNNGRMTRGGMTRGGVRNSSGDGGRDRGRGHGRVSGISGGRGGGGKNPIDKSADELDKELDKYHAEAMQT